MSSWFRKRRLVVYHYTRSGEPTRDFENVRWDNTRMPWPDDYARETRPARSPLAALGEDNQFPLGVNYGARSPARFDRDFRS